MAKPKSKSADPVTFVKDKSEEGTNWTVLRQIQINRSFYRGFQWISWDKIQKRIYVPDLRPGEKRYTYNKIKPAILTLQAKLCKNRVQLEVTPDTDDDERIETARGSIKFLKYQWGEDNMDHKSRRLRFHMLVDGFPALKVYVDKTKGQDISYDEADVDMDDILEKNIPSKTGKICTQVVDQLRLKVDPNAEDLEEIKWAIDEYPMDVDEIQETWGKEVEPEDNITMRQTFEQFMSMDVIVKRFKNMAMVYDYWELPSAKYPNGRRIVVAGDQMLEENSDPGEFPFIFFPAIPVPSRAVADGVVTDLTTPQKSYNIKRTAEARILEEMGNPMWTIPRGSVDDYDQISNEIGGVVEYNVLNGFKPERVQGNSPDQGWQLAMERDQSDMDDMSGAHDISQGAAPKGNDTYSGMALQVEQDETKLSLLVQSYEDGMKKWGEKVLRLVQKYFPEEQQLSIVGENGEIEAFSFSGADLTGGEVVDVVPGSSMPTLKAAEDQKIMTMWQMGMFIDPHSGQPDTRKAMRLLSETAANNYFDSSLQDENKARLENRVWEKAFEDPKAAQALMQYARQVQVYKIGTQLAQQKGMDPSDAGFQPPQPPLKLPMVRDFYDHQTHIDIHNRFRKMEEYDNLPPELQMLVDSHVEEHTQALQAPGNAMQQQAMMMQQQEAQAQQQQAQAAQQQVQLQAQKVQVDSQNKQAQLQLEAMKTHAEMQRTSAQFEQERQMKTMDQQHDWNKTLLGHQVSMQQAQMNDGGAE